MKKSSAIFGKPHPNFMRKVVFKRLGAKNQLVLVGPGEGLDNAVLSLQDGRVLIITTDPISIIPSIDIKESAWLSVHLVASDFATSGVKPEFALFDLNIPQEIDDSGLQAYIKAIDAECRTLGISVVGGHTGRYPGGGLTVVGSGTIFGIARDGSYLTPAMAQEDDVVVMTKGAAIETVAILANAFPMTIRERLGRKLADSAQAYLKKCSVFDDAFAAISTGIKEAGVTSMHDATEGGVLGALSEMAAASGKRIVVEKEKIHISKEAELVCSAFDIDPLLSLSEGTLLITCKKTSVQGVIERLKKNDVDGFVIGNVVKGDSGLWIRERSRIRRFMRPKEDPYWRAYSQGVANEFK